ncbi:hypothetical protein KBI52_15720 [Microvirga sp. HBU67558]|uniref:hypothetical protein n=1 Tax=Microvirga TaxID=186650 RepID=UPI001B36167C|nr:MULTISPECIES: hypothetical protein [unclassified Microvirga]MBQ0821641.1 hypothetical protein [Microvirga sp. HBU67558]
MEIDLKKLQQLAQSATPDNAWPFDEKAFRAMATPAAVLELIERLETAEALAEALEETLGEKVARLTEQRDEFQERAETAEYIVNDDLPHITQCPGCYMVHDPRLGQPEHSDLRDERELLDLAVTPSRFVIGVSSTREGARIVINREDGDITHVLYSEFHPPGETCGTFAAPVVAVAPVRAAAEIGRRIDAAAQGGDLG